MFYVLCFYYFYLNWHLFRSLSIDGFTFVVSTFQKNKTSPIRNEKI